MKYLHAKSRSSYPLTLAWLLALLLTTAGTVHGACSSQFEKAYLNEYFFGVSQNFIEVYIPNNQQVDSTEWDNWSVRVYTGVNTYQAYPLNAASVCEFGSKTYLTYNVADLPGEGSTVNAVLLDGSSLEIDYLKFDRNSPIAEYVSPSCSYDAQHDIDYQFGSYGNKDVARFPDGSGDWSDSSLTGANTTHTRCASNDASLSKSVNASTIPVGLPGYFTINVSNPSNKSISSVTVTDQWPDELVLDSWSASTGSFDANTMIWSIGSMARNTAASLQLNFHGDIAGSYLNSAQLSYDGMSSASTSSAIANIVSALDHLRVLHDGAGLTCAPETVILQACQNSDCTELYSGDVSADFTVNGSAVQSVTISGGSATLSFRHTTAGDITLGAVATSTTVANPTRCLSTSETCTMTFAEAGFILDVPTLTANKTSLPVTITAVKTTDSGETCAPAFSGARTVSFWSTWANPVTGSALVSINDTTIATSSPGTALSLEFDSNAQAEITVHYPDAGLMQLDARYDGSGEDAGLVLLGNDQFVVQPVGLCLQSSDANADCTAGNHTCTAFKKAGETFNLTVRAVAWEVDSDSDLCAGNAVTPNFQLDGVALGSSLVAPLGGQPGSVGASSLDFTASDNGEKTIPQSISEVGVFSFTATPGVNSYFSTTPAGGNSANIGRFYPADFSVSHNPNAACNSSFTYAGHAASKSGQPFTVMGTVTARNLATAITANYQGDFVNLFASDITAEARIGAAAASGSLNFALASDPLFINGIGTFQVDDARYAFASEGAPQNMHLRITATDGDGVTGSDDDAGKAVEYRFGRLRLSSAHGPETLALDVPLLSEYFTATGYYTTNLLDGCTMLTLADHLQLSTDNGVSWVNGDASITVDAGTTSATLANSPLLSGSAGLSFSAPGAGNTGSVDIRGALATAYPWLLYDWDGNGAHDNEPRSRLTFGIYKGSSKKIYVH